LSEDVSGYRGARRVGRERPGTASAAGERGRPRHGLRIRLSLGCCTGAVCGGPSPPSARIIRIARPRRALRPHRGPRVIRQRVGWRLGRWSGRH